MNSKSLTVIIPAYNEANGLRGTYESVTKALLTAGISDYEIFLMTVTDPNGRHDGTPDVAVRIAAEDSKVSHFHTPFFTGLGNKYREGVHAATKNYVMLVPGHNLTEENSILSIMLHLDQTEAIFTYTGNPEVRPPEARFVSKVFVTLCNILFGLNFRYYNGISVIRRDLLLKIPMVADDYSFFTEIIVYLVKSGVKYLELPQILKKSERTGREWSIENSFKVAGSLLALFWKINVKEETISVGPEDTRLANISLPAPQGLPDLGAIVGFAKGNAVQTLHQILVYIAKSGAKYMGLSGNTETNDRASLLSNINNLAKIAGVLSLFAGKTLLRMSTVASNTSNGTVLKKKRSRRKKEPVSLSVIMPACREVDNLRPAYESAIRAISNAGIIDYEILIATVPSPDSTPDNTHLVAAQIAQEDSHVRSLPSQQFYGLGYKFREAAAIATKKYTMMIPGDGEFEENSLTELLTHIGKADLIIPFIGNPEVRPPERQIVSRGFITLCNTFFGLNLKYYNGLCIIPTEYLKAVPMSCDNFAFMAEILIFLIKSGVQYLEVPWKIKPSVESKAFKTESVTEALETLSSLFWKINVEGLRVEIPK